LRLPIRALSPAVNDTFTGVACVDWLADALLVLAEQPPIEGNWYDTAGELRVWVPAVRIERLVKLAFDQIRQASATTPAVLIRQLEAIRRVGLGCPTQRTAFLPSRRRRFETQRPRSSHWIAATSRPRTNARAPRSSISDPPSSSGAAG